MVPTKEKERPKKMRKHRILRSLISVVLTAVMALGTVPFVSAEGAGLGNFTHRYDYDSSVFTDVQEKDWFYENVKSVYELGLMNGKGQQKFDTAGYIKVSETLTIAARLHSIYNKGSDTFEKTSPWYQTYVDYCTANGLFDSNGADLDAAATREVFTAILAKALPEEELADINTIEEGYIPDVDVNSEYAPAIYSMYRAGITIGKDSAGTFTPESNIKRSEVAAIITRLVDPSLRMKIQSTLKIYVDPNGNDSTADGSESAPYATIEAARDAARKADKSKYDVINVILNDGIYTISKPIEFNASDSGTETCEVKYSSSGNAIIVGGVALKSSDFTKATGSYAQYIPAAVRDKIVQLDLTKIGFSMDTINSILDNRYVLAVYPAFAVDGEVQTIARFPDTDWITIGARSTMLDQYGNPTMVTDNDNNPEFEAQTVRIEYGDEYADRVRSWHANPDLRVGGRFAVLWVGDNSQVLSIDQNDCLITTPYMGGYAPVEGGLLYFYNIPEELDQPGEYLIGRDGILYYYPKDGFDSSVMSIPLSEGLVSIDGTSYFTFEGIKFESSLGEGIYGTGNYITIIDCEISSICGEHGVRLTGNNILFQGNYVHDLNRYGVVIHTGDIETLTLGNTVAYNNVIHDWGIAIYPYADGLAVYGCGALIHHNHVYSSNASAIDSGGAFCIIEYNDVHDVLKTSDDIGAIGNTGYHENITRYNYIHNIGAIGAAAESPNLNKMGSAAIYWDGGSSYAEAYGNVIETVKGHGVIMNGGRHLSVHSNLIIDCSFWYVQTVCTPYTRAVESGFTEAVNKYPAFVHSDVWKKTAPELSTIVQDLSKTNEDDPQAWCAPAGDVIMDNWCHFNKFVRHFSNWGVRPYYIEDGVYKFNPDTIDVSGSGQNEAHTTSYNSRRDSVDIQDLLEKAAGVVDMDWERFQTIGIVEADWHLGEIAE